MSTNQTSISKTTHLKFLEQALSEARKSPPKSTNFRVGCVIVSFESPTSPSILSLGYTLELEGNTHAEQCALSKLASSHNVPESSLPSILSSTLNAYLYTTLEPCGKRLSGNTPCVQRIIATRKNNPEGGIRRVIFGAKEPGTFVQDSQSCRMLMEAGIDWEYIEGLDDEILSTAMEGHEPKKMTSEPQKEQAKQPEAGERPSGTNVDDISPEERKRQEAQPHNPQEEDDGSSAWERLIQAVLYLRLLAVPLRAGLYEGGRTPRVSLHTSSNPLLDMNTNWLVHTVFVRRNSQVFYSGEVGSAKQLVHPLQRDPTHTLANSQPHISTSNVPFGLRHQKPHPDRHHKIEAPIDGSTCRTH